MAQLITAARISELENVRQINRSLQEELLDKLEDEESKIENLEADKAQIQSEYDIKCKQVEQLEANKEKRASQIIELQNSLNISSRETTKIWSELQMTTKLVQQKTDQIESIIECNDQKKEISKILESLNDEVNTHRASVSADIRRLNRERRASQEMITQIEDSLISHESHRFVSISSTQSLNSADLKEQNEELQKGNRLLQASQTFDPRLNREQSKEIKYASCYGTHLQRTQSLPSDSALIDLCSFTKAKSFDAKGYKVPHNTPNSEFQPNSLPSNWSMPRLDELNEETSELNEANLALFAGRFCVESVETSSVPPHSIEIKLGMSGIKREVKSMGNCSIRSSDQKTDEFTIMSDSMIVNPATSRAQSWLSSQTEANDEVQKVEEVNGLVLTIADLKKKIIQTDGTNSELSQVNERLKHLNWCQINIIKRILRNFRELNMELNMSTQQELRQFSCFLSANEMMVRQVVSKLQAQHDDSANKKLKEKSKHWKDLYEKQLELNRVIDQNESKLNERYEEEKAYAQKLRIKLDETIELLKESKLKNKRMSTSKQD